MLWRNEDTASRPSLVFDVSTTLLWTRLCHILIHTIEADKILAAQPRFVITDLAGGCARCNHDNRVTRRHVLITGNATCDQNMQEMIIRTAGFQSINLFTWVVLAHPFEGWGSGGNGVFERGQSPGKCCRSDVQICSFLT